MISEANEKLYKIERIADEIIVMLIANIVFKGFYKKQFISRKIFCKVQF